MVAVIASGHSLPPRPHPLPLRTTRKLELRRGGRGGGREAGVTGC